MNSSIIQLQTFGTCIEPIIDDNDDDQVKKNLKTKDHGAMKEEIKRLAWTCQKM